jgi:WD40 repeat protein
MALQSISRRITSALLSWALLTKISESFVPNKKASTQHHLFDGLSQFYDDFEDFSTSPGEEKNDDDWFVALRSRQDSLELSASNDSPSQISEKCLSNWKQANCASTVRLALDDWIRRLAIDTYPLAVCGSASGNIYLADLQRGQELDCLPNVHPAQIFEEDSEYSPQFTDAIDTLYGDFDGGGVLAIAMKGDLIASAGREGGVHICTIAGREEDFYKGSRGGTARQTQLSLKREGSLRGLETDSSILITSLAFDAIGVLWMGGYDGVLRAYDAEKVDVDGRPMMLRQKHPLYSTGLNSPIISLSVNNEVGCGVGTSKDLGVFLFSLEDGSILDTWKPFGKRNECWRTATIVENNPNEKWSIVCGGSEGTLFQRQLNVDKMTGFVSDDKPFHDQYASSADLPMKLRPAHMGAVVAMASPAPGIFVSGAQDGNIRVWDCSYSTDEEDEEEEAQYDDVGSSESRPRCLYAMTGYKVWLGSIFANGKKLTSDGADNTIIVHSFDGNEEDVMFREDEDDEGGLAFE